MPLLECLEQSVKLLENALTLGLATIEVLYIYNIYNILYKYIYIYSIYILATIKVLCRSKKSIFIS